MKKKLPRNRQDLIEIFESSEIEPNNIVLFHSNTFRWFVSLSKGGEKDPLGAIIEPGMFVTISAKVQQNRMVDPLSVRLVDTSIPKYNAFYPSMTESAKRTLFHPECTPLKLPEDKYESWKNITITFDYSIMTGQ